MVHFEFRVPRALPVCLRLAVNSARAKPVAPDGQTIVLQNEPLPKRDLTFLRSKLSAHEPNVATLPRQILLGETRAGRSLKVEWQKQAPAGTCFAPLRVCCAPGRRRDGVTFRPLSQLARRSAQMSAVLS